MALLSQKDFAVLSLPINCAAQGNNIIIPGATGIGYRIWKLWLVAAGGVTLTYQFDNTPMSGPVPLVTDGSHTVPYDGVVNFLIPVGSAFVINLSAPVQLGGTVYYTKDYGLSQLGQ
jgi:hypothetical protein